MSDCISPQGGRNGGRDLRADLHLHSLFSDGAYTPDEICAIAKARGLSLLSITDHDSLNGEDEKRSAAEKQGLLYLSGWEISAYEDGYKLHVLGYGCRRGKDYLQFMQKRTEAAYIRAQDSLRKFASLGVEITMDEVNACRADLTSPIHTMHIARAAAKKLNLSEGETYLNYLARGKAANSTYGRPTPQEAIEVIHASGGVAVLAHPGRIFMPQPQLEDRIKCFTRQGLDGIECYYTTHTQRQTEYFLSLADGLNLLKTGGSDTHIEDETHQIGAPAFTPDSRFLDKFF